MKLKNTERCCHRRGLWNFAICVWIAALLVNLAHGANSLLRYEDIPKMTEAGISKEVIDYFTANQTTSIRSEDVIQMKKSGLTKADLYKQELKPTVMEEAELIAQLKAAGMSDENIQQFIDQLKADTNRYVDAKGNLIKTYKSESKRPQYPTSGSVLPEHRNYYYEPFGGRFHILVTPPAE
jgi:hypothetical protein